MAWDIESHEIEAIGAELLAMGRDDLLGVMQAAYQFGVMPRGLAFGAGPAPPGVAAFDPALLDEAELCLRDLLARHVADPSRRQPRKLADDPGRSHGMTRDCLDPWRYLEVDTSGGLKPCCIMPPLARLAHGQGQVALDGRASAGPAFRALRKRLLEGRLQENCEACHIRAEIPVAGFREKLVALAQGGATFWRRCRLPICALMSPAGATCVAITARSPARPITARIWKNLC